jgi:H+/Cl- antiporter ClcA
MDRSIPTVVLMIGIAIGATVGIAFAVARRAWQDYQKAKAGVPVLRKAAWALIRIVTTRAGLVALLLAAAVTWAAVGERTP